MNRTLMGTLNEMCRKGNGRRSHWGEYLSKAVMLLNTTPRALMGCIMSPMEAKQGHPLYGYGSVSKSRCAHLIGRKLITEIIICTKV